MFENFEENFEREDEYGEYYKDDSSRGCSDCPDDECTGHCMSCFYRSV